MVDNARRKMNSNSSNRRVSWEGCNIADILYDAQRGTATIVFFVNSMDAFIKVVGRNVMLFKVSNTPDDMETPHFADIVMEECCLQDAMDRLVQSGYGWRIFRAIDGVNHLHAEGGTVLDIFCAQEFECSTLAEWS